MPQEKSPSALLVAIAKILDELKISYFVTGGFAVSVWGRPRFTADIDLIIKLALPQKPAFSRRLKKLSPHGYLDSEQINTALARQGEFNFIDPETGMKVDFWVAKDENFEKECFRRSLGRKINGRKIVFISPEDLILSKLIWYKATGSTRHLEDIESVLAATKVNASYVKKWATKLAVTKELEKIKGFKNILDD